MKLLIFSLIIGFLSVNLCSAYPISPRTLRQLYINSELVVEANVVKTESVKLKSSHYTAKANLQVSSFLKGESSENPIEVYYYKYLICPQPATYKSGEIVIAFLNKMKNRINFINHLTNDQKNKLFVILKSAKSDEDGMPPNTYYLMSILSKATKNKNLDHIVNLYRKIDYYDKKKVKTERKLADEFITKYPLQK